MHPAADTAQLGGEETLPDKLISNRDAEMTQVGAAEALTQKTSVPVSDLHVLHHLISDNSSGEQFLNPETEGNQSSEVEEGSHVYSGQHRNEHQSATMERTQMADNDVRLANTGCHRLTCSEQPEGSRSESASLVASSDAEENLDSTQVSFLFTSS